MVKGSSFGFWFAVGNVCHSVTWWLFLFQQKGDEGEEGVTSEEFDKFLEERAKAVERVPSLPSPPSGNPGAVQGTPSRKKPERPEDTLFAA